jgi:protein-tyrosine-phosphatase
MTTTAYNVLFLCSGNSARSILAEALMSQIGKDRFNAFSAGSAPRGHLLPETEKLLATLQVPAGRYRSKSWEEFQTADAPRMDFVFTLCDDTARESCPKWPGTPMVGHWSLPDPAAVTGSEAEKAAAFAEVARQLRNRIELLCALPIHALDTLSLRKHLDTIAAS